MHDGLQPVSLLQETQDGGPAGAAEALLTVDRPAVQPGAQVPVEAPQPSRPRRAARHSAEQAQPAPARGAPAVAAAHGPVRPVPVPVQPTGEPELPSGSATAAELTDDRLVRPRRVAPGSGWRRAVFRATFGLVNPGESPAELRYQALVARAQAPVSGCHRIAVVSSKGGVGKTSTTLGLGATAASVRGDRVVALDANPHLGTLGERVRRDNPSTVRDLLRADQLDRYPDVRAYTSQTPARLEVLAAEGDPALSEAFDEADYRRVCDTLGRFYNLIVTDCGTGLLHSAMAGVLGLADQIVLIAAPAVDGARSAAATLDWLDAHGRCDLVRHAVVVVSAVRRGGAVDVDRVVEHFAGRCRFVLQVPYDPHLAEGAQFDLDALRPKTRRAYVELAAAVADGFANPGRTA